MITLVTVIHVLVCIFLILVILLQAGKGGGMGAAFGGAGAQTVFGGRGAQTFLGKVTSVSAVIFMLTSLDPGLQLVADQVGARRARGLGADRPGRAAGARRPGRRPRPRRRGLGAGPAPGARQVAAGRQGTKERDPALAGSLRRLAVPRARFELARLTAPPPQDGVSTSSTTWA